MGNFTLDARRKLLRAGGALSRFDPLPGNCIFLTGTLPGGTPAACRTMAKYSAEIVNRLKSWVTKRYSSQQFSFYCWELQKRGALHLHYLLYCPVPEIRKGVIESFKKFWTGLMLSISEKSCVDMFARKEGGTHRENLSVVQAYAQECYKSVSAYMAKYVGKQAGKGDTANFPSTWSGVSRPLTALIREYSEEVKFVTPSYTKARNIYTTSAEELTDTQAVTYAYKHKVGVGDTQITYYKEDKDLQQCHLNRVSKVMSSKNLHKPSSIPSKREALVSTCLIASCEVIRPYYPDYLNSTPSLPDWLLTILVESLRVPSGGDNSEESMLELRSMMTTQLLWIYSVSTNTHIRSMLLTHQSRVLEQENVLHSERNLRQTVRSVEMFRQNLRLMLTSLPESVYRSTTKPNSDEGGGDPITTGAPSGSPSSPVQGHLFPPS